MEGEIDSTFQTQQRDMFTSGIVAEIGVNAYAVWSVIKCYSDFATGEAYPGMREIGAKIGLGKSTVQRAVEMLQAAHMLRVVADAKFKRKGQTYIARERLGADKKLAHFVVSYDQDKPSEAVLRDTEDSMLAAMELDKNHFATFLHNDNGYWHLHIFVSRIEKEKPHRGNALWQDMTIRDKVCREVEIRHGLQRDNGMHEINAADLIVEIPRDVRRARRDAKLSGISNRARTTEIYSGEKSFQTWANEIRIGDRLKHAKNWQDLHAAAAAYGCEVKSKGAGFVICPANEKGGIQLSKVGLKNLPAKFGAFQIAKQGYQVQPETTYKPEPTQANGTGHYDKWREAKKIFLPIRTGRLNEQRETHKRIRQNLRAAQKVELTKIRTETKGSERFSAISIAKMQHAVKMAELADHFSHERLLLRRQLAEQGPGNTFRDYLVIEASKGDNTALGLARKYGMGEATEVSRKREIDHLQIVAAVTGLNYRPAPRLSFTHQVERSGTVVFHLGLGRMITDSAISKQIQLNDAAANSPEAIATALRFATTKFGNTLTLTGSQEFQRLAVETAVIKGLGIKFADPALEAYREKFAAEQQRKSPTQLMEKQYASNHRRKHIGQIPPSHRRDRMHFLSDGDLVLDTERDVGALRKNVPDRMEQHQERGNHGMQRAAGRATGGSERGSGLPRSSGSDRINSESFGKARFASAGGQRTDSKRVDLSVDLMQPQKSQQVNRAATFAEDWPVAGETPTGGPASEEVIAKTPEDLLREKILAIDPDAKFITADTSSKNLYSGPIIVKLEPEYGIGFVQRTNRGVYTLHFAAPPKQAGNIDIQYQANMLVATVTDRKGLDR